MARAVRGAIRGQALVFGLILLFLASIGLFFVFSTGQLADTRLRLVNTADAAALSAAQWRARVLNFHAYANRAIVANEVAVAQAATFVSWSKYFETFTRSASELATLYPPVAPFFEGLAEAAALARQSAELSARFEVAARAASVVGYKELLATSQEILNLTAGGFGLSMVAAEVARANDPGFFAFTLPEGDAYNRFTRRWSSDADRERLAKLVRESLDGFTGGARRNDLMLFPFVPSGCFGTTTDTDRWFDWLRKRGATVLADDLDRWEAVDTASWHRWRRSSGFLGLFGSCRDREQLPLGWGAAEVVGLDPLGSVLDGDGGEGPAGGGSGGTGSGTGSGSGGSSGGSSGDGEGAGPGTGTGATTLTATAFDLLKNPRAYELADADVSSLWPYAGIGRVRELDYARQRDPDDPRSRVAVVVRLDDNRLRTANTLDLGTGRLRMAEVLHGNRMWAVSSAEVYFRRPNGLPGVPQRAELASLYSPYWQARLVAPNDAERGAALAYGR